MCSGRSDEYPHRSRRNSTTSRRVKTAPRASTPPFVASISTACLIAHKPGRDSCRAAGKDACFVTDRPITDTAFIGTSPEEAPVQRHTSPPRRARPMLRRLFCSALWLPAFCRSRTGRSRTPSGTVHARVLRLKCVLLQAWSTTLSSYVHHFTPKWCTALPLNPCQGLEPLPQTERLSAGIPYTHTASHSQRE